MKLTTCYAVIAVLTCSVASAQAPNPLAMMAQAARIQAANAIATGEAAKAAVVLTLPDYAVLVQNVLDDSTASPELKELVAILGEDIDHDVADMNSASATAAFEIVEARAWKLVGDLAYNAQSWQLAMTRYQTATAHATQVPGWCNQSAAFRAMALEKIAILQLYSNP